MFFFAMKSLPPSLDQGRPIRGADPQRRSVLARRHRVHPSGRHAGPRGQPVPRPAKVHWQAETPTTASTEASAAMCQQLQDLQSAHRVRRASDRAVSAAEADEGSRQVGETAHSRMVDRRRCHRLAWPGCGWRPVAAVSPAGAAGRATAGTIVVPVSFIPGRGGQHLDRGGRRAVAEQRRGRGVKHWQSRSSADWSCGSLVGRCRATGTASWLGRCEHRIPAPIQPRDGCADRDLSSPPGPGGRLWGGGGVGRAGSLVNRPGLGGVGRPGRHASCR